MRLVVAAHSRELRTALFLALSPVDDVDIVATANSFGELRSYCRTLRPDAAVVEMGLPGRGFDDALAELAELLAAGRVFVVNGAGADEAAERHANVERFTGVEMLIDSVP